jgi:mono/diheme cytochrome c family protein
MKLRRTLSLAFAALVVAGLASQPLNAKLPWVKKAQGMGFKEIENCASCHSSKTPKKGEPMAERGKWLVEQKEKHKAEEVDLAWLKDYKGK